MIQFLIFPLNYLVFDLRDEEADAVVGLYPLLLGLICCGK
jgi:hypothetical protein